VPNRPCVISVITPIASPSPTTASLPWLATRSPFVGATRLTTTNKS
jgi:hypothetical protein